MSRTTKNCFSNSLEAEHWMTSNCDRCKKNQREGTFHCKIQREIFNQWLGYGNEEVDGVTYEACQFTSCPRFIERNAPAGKHRTKKDHPNQLTLFCNERSWF